MASPVRGCSGYPGEARTTQTAASPDEDGRGGEPVERAGGHGQEELGGVAGQQRQHDLGLGIAEAHVVLNDLGAVVPQHEAGVEHAPVVDAPAAQRGDQRLHRRRP